MTPKPVAFAATTGAAAEGGTMLNAFDNALLAAGIGNVNLVKLSSIMPPAVKIITLPHLKAGALVPAAYAAVMSDVPGETIAAAIGWARPDDPGAAGVIMEVHDRIGAKEAERAVERMLDEAFQARGAHMRDRRILAVEHQVKATGCAIAAVTLLSADLVDRRAELYLDPVRHLISRSPLQRLVLRRLRARALLRPGK